MSVPTSKVAVIVVDEAPKVIRWVERADDLSWLPIEGDEGWSSIDDLDPATLDLLVECGRTCTVPFLVANAEALTSDADELVCRIDGREYRQAPFGYQGKCLGWLGWAYIALGDADRSRAEMPR